MEFITSTIKSPTPGLIDKAAEITALGFNRPNDFYNRCDTINHVDNMDLFQVATHNERLAGYVGFRKILGDRVIELSGIVIHPDFQNNGIGKKLVDDAIKHFKPEAITSFTRNPSVLRLLDDVSDGDVFSNTNKLLSLSLPNVTTSSDGYNYHINRFAPNGLYGSNDPAEQLYKGEVFMNHFFELKNICSALALAIKVKKG